jgi:hypothetical protein
MSDYDSAFDDPEPLDEDDPAVLEEMFEMHKYRGVKPKELLGATPEHRQKYADWLESQKD